MVPSSLCRLPLSINEGEFANHQTGSVHLNDRHQDIPDFCGRIACRKKGRWKKRELIRHLKQHSDHQSSATPIFHCRCKATFKRRSKFRDHLKKFTCKGDQLLRCWCGEVTFDCRTGDDMRGFEDHFRSCGLRKKGRPPKDRK